MYHTKHHGEKSTYEIHSEIHELREHDNAVGLYSIAGLSFVTLSPVFVYLYFTLSNPVFKMVGGLSLLLILSHIVAKLLYHFIERYENSRVEPTRESAFDNSNLGY